MAIKTIAGAPNINANVVDGIAGPFFPSDTTTGVTNIDYYQFSGTPFFSAGATTVFGKPASTTTALTNLNAPWIWSDTAFPGAQPGSAGGFVTNPNSVITLDANGRVDVEEDMQIAINGNRPQNFGFMRGLNTNRPVFYGTTFTLGVQSTTFRELNFIGVNGGGGFADNNVAAPQFHSCRMVQERSSTPHNVRFQSPNYIMNGFDYVNLNGSGAFELTVPAKIAPQGLRLLAPNFTDLRSRQILLFTNAFSIGASGPEQMGTASDGFNRYTFNQPDAANFSLYSGNVTATRVYRPERGVHLINPIGSPIPLSTNTTLPTDGSTTVNLLLPARESGTLSAELRSGQNTATKRVRINFDQDGYTLRIRRTEVRMFDHRTGSFGVTWKGIARTTGNGSLALASIDATTFSTNTPTLGPAVNSTTQNESNSQFNFVSVDTGNLPAGDVFRGTGYDTELTGSTASVLLPAHLTVSDNATTHGRVAFFEYEVWGHHDQRGVTNRQTVNFIPGHAQFNTALETGADITLNFTSPVDTKVSADTSSVSLLASAALPTTSQALYDNIKVYQRVRGSATDYGSSRLNSFNRIIADGNTQIDLGALDLGLNGSGRLVDLTGNDLQVRVGTTLAALATGVSETWTTTGDIDLAVFRRNVGGRTLNATNFINMGDSTGGSLTGTTIDFSNAAGTVTINGTDLSGIPNAGWTIATGQTVILDEPATNLLGGTRVNAINAAEAGTLQGTFNNRTYTHEDFSGVWGVYNVTDSGWEVDPVRYTTGGTPNTFNRDSSDPDTYQFYWKRDSVNVNGFYEVATENFDPSTLTSVLPTLTLASDQGNTALYTPNSSITLSGSVASALPTTARVTEGGEQVLRISYKSRANANITYLRDADVDKYLFAAATNTTAYIDVMGRRRLSSDYIGFGGGDTRIDPDYVQLDTFFTNEQQEVTSVFDETGGTPFPSTSINGLTALAGVPSVLVLDNPAGLTSGQALSAVREGIRQENVAIDQDLANLGFTGVVSRDGTALGVDLTE